MNIDDFHRALFAIANEGTKARIALPNHANIITEYEIEQTPLFSMKTLKKYKNELYSFKGVSLSNSDDRIGIIWCFNILKVYFIDHYQTLEPVTRFGEYFIFYKEKYVITRRLKEEKQSDIIEDLHIDSIINAESIPKDIFTPINNPKISHIAEYMSSVKIIRFLPFPTCTTIQKMLVGRAVPTGGFSDEEKKKIIFVEMAASVHYINLIFLPEVSIRFEMVFDLNIVLLENTIENIKKYAYNPNKIGQFSKDASFVNQYIDDKDIDIAHLVHSGVNEGSTNLKMLKPFHRDKYTGITTDDFMIFGYFEHIFCHEISHQLGAPHTWTYTNQQEHQQEGSGFKGMKIFLLRLTLQILRSIK
ncbi:hypothetical protein TVAG_210170 [Trichomonas vaginalis G3]|uniref:Uncharacterized protein n=1 Tax=Trichomonas vaginalis (strain ATCC PRA-98 / G3) TaxID=412133 RepID=A2DVS4_TRIV3|nr:Metallo-peptidase family M12B Reprolysin-like family [Trichomonas vaginalis G3]EAY15487.1 hypothetical protein TVAG_210170 [Trichomonas vaginalis G3]KAI5511497.1 Metallo-peptidase family M12B Reprolysin-like family [Trichomonas vaginalis G3]|eukprot:XP_001327710.1 hypothetical protein [Trichomonas vaginalis G3]